jgi:CRP/FNR family transcriptional regulator, cyclic AMP receptor protein
MDLETDVPRYRIWAVDNVVYGPVDLPTLVRWVQEERVTATTWVHIEESNRWELAPRIPELTMFFRGTGPGTGKRGTKLSTDTGTWINITPGTLRRVKIFAGLTDEQLERFLGLMELQRVGQWEEIVKEGSPGDAMFLLLEGEVRVRLMIAGKESILTTLTAGEFFGEVALFDHGPRSADVVANTDCLLLRIPAGSFQKLVQDIPDLAAPFLHAMGRSLIARIRADNKRYRDSIAFARSATQFHRP